MNEDLKQRAILLREEGNTVAKISKILGVPQSTVARNIKHIKIAPIPPDRSAIRFDNQPDYPAIVERVRAMRASGIQVQDIARELNLDKRRIAKMSAGMYTASKLWWPQARADYEAGMQRPELCQKYGRSKTSIDRALHGLTRTKTSRGGFSQTMRKRCRSAEARVRELRLEGKSAEEISELTGLSIRGTQSIAKRIGHPFVKVPPPSRLGMRRISFGEGKKQSNADFVKKHMPISAEEARVRMVKMRIANQMSQFNNSGKAQKVSLPRLSILESEDA